MNREWELISAKSSRDPGVYSCCPDDTFPSVTFTFVLQRHSGSYTAIVVVPAAGEYNRWSTFFFQNREATTDSTHHKSDMKKVSI